MISTFAQGIKRYFIQSVEVNGGINYSPSTGKIGIKPIPGAIDPSDSKLAYCICILRRKISRCL